MFHVKRVTWVGGSASLEWSSYPVLVIDMFHCISAELGGACVCLASQSVLGFLFPLPLRQTSIFVRVFFNFHIPLSASVLYENRNNQLSSLLCGLGQHFLVFRHRRWVPKECPLSFLTFQVVLLRLKQWIHSLNDNVHGDFEDQCKEGRVNGRGMWHGWKRGGNACWRLLCGNLKERGYLKT
jgi:hypothetical protein